MDGGIQWTTLIITEEDEPGINNSTEGETGERGRQRKGKSGRGWFDESLGHSWRWEEKGAIRKKNVGEKNRRGKSLDEGMSSKTGGEKITWQRCFAGWSERKGKQVTPHGPSVIYCYIWNFEAENFETGTTDS